jgi:hypothetical protein
MGKWYWIPLISLILSVGLFILFPFIGLGSLLVLFLGVIVEGVREYRASKKEEKTEKSEKEIKEKLKEIKSDSKRDKIEERIVLKVKESLKNKKISIQSIINKLQNPIYSILIQKYFEAESQDKSKQKIYNNIINLGFKGTKGGVYILPPKNCPNINENFSIEEWTKKNVLKGVSKGYKYIINFVVLIDIRKAWSNRILSEKSQTISEILSADTNLMTTLLVKLDNKATIKDVIKGAGIGFLIEKDCTEKELEVISKDNDKIIEEIGKKDILSLFATDEKTLSEVIKKYCADYGSVSKQIIENSRFWNNYLF